MYIIKVYCLEEIKEKFLFFVKGIELKYQNQMKFLCSMIFSDTPESSNFFMLQIRIAITYLHNLQYTELVLCIV
jgi:hypothetical protein